MSDEPYTPFVGRRSEPAAPILITRLWRVRHPTTFRVLSCALYLHPHGIEVRCGYQNEENLLMSQVLTTPDAARTLAAEWKAMVMGRGYQEIADEPKGERPR